MDYTRALEIFNSPKTFEVLFDGSPIWIESLDSEQKTALISSGDFDDGQRTVPVGQLRESPSLF